MQDEAMVHSWDSDGRDMKAPSFPLYVNNWLASWRISAMTPEQEGGYIHLLCHAWNAPNCALPDDDAMLASLSRLGARWAEVGSAIRACFIRTDAGMLVNERLLKCWSENQAYRAACSRAGKAGAKGRYAVAMRSPQRAHGSESESASDSDTTSQIKTPPVSPVSGDAHALHGAKHTVKTIISKLYHRRDATPWADKELATLRRLCERPEILAEADTLAKYKQQLDATGKGHFFRHDIQTLLNNWTGELDRAAANRGPVAAGERSAADAVAEALR